MPATSLLLQVDSSPDGEPLQHTPREQPALPSAPPTAAAPRVAPQPQFRGQEPSAAQFKDPQVNALAEGEVDEEATAGRSMSRVYELQREEAKRLVRRALRAGAAIGV